MHLIPAIARRVRRLLPYSIPLEDLISEGHVSLVLAAREFDPGRGLPFRIWALFKIRQGIIDAYKGRNFAWELHASLQDETHHTSPSPFEGAYLNQQRRLLDEAMDRAKPILTPKERAALARVRAGRQMQSIGREFHLSTRGACKVRDRAIRKVQRYLELNETPSATAA
jgi:RNA polymerase sigma factor (sigma-70 family)